MDGRHFDTLTRALTTTRSRRGLGAILLGSALGLLGQQRSPAKKKKKQKACPTCKKRKQGKCTATLPNGTGCSGGTCQGGQCVAAVVPPPPSPPPACAGTTISGRCALGCGAECTGRNGGCGYTLANAAFCYPAVANICVSFPDICTQDAGCEATELCIATGCIAGGQGRCIPIFAP